MLTPAEFIQLRQVLGIPVTFTTAKTPVQTANLSAVVQPLNSRDEALINSYGVGAKTIQMLATDLPVAPVKFDAVQCVSERLVIDTVVPQYTRGTGVISFYLCYVKGK